MARTYHFQSLEKNFLNESKKLCPQRSKARAGENKFEIHPQLLRSSDLWEQFAKFLLSAGEVLPPYVSLFETFARNRLFI